MGGERGERGKRRTLHPKPQTPNPHCSVLNEGGERDLANDEGLVEVWIFCFQLRASNEPCHLPARPSTVSVSAGVEAFRAGCGEGEKREERGERREERGERREWERREARGARRGEKREAQREEEGGGRREAAGRAREERGDCGREERDLAEEGDDEAVMLHLVHVTVRYHS
jgi:hypothetical protein